MDDVIEIENILPEKSIIKTRHPGSYDWVTTIIRKAYGNCIEVEQVEDYMVKVIMIGDNLLIKYSDNEYLYTIESTVQEIKFASRAVLLTVNSIKRIKNIRYSYRYDAYLSSSLKMMQDFSEVYSVVTNLSNTGMSIITKGYMEIGEKVDMNVYLSSDNIINFKCEIKWSDVIWPNNMYGVHILDMDNVNREKYEGYIKKLERKEKRLISKYINKTKM
ncbi:PilZ domain-containing protein [Pseudobacteroides cellulosolvens]|uniref:Type IV pilus assembly PilZ n=1 Tax=Pseudobacteroides cellulosolvens ATCC 35603 = DSM 2933 TaxID=398512 RepID=A0A0L6JN88_9FIRM|nr:PilZ domain-containing protein [Pseudobacteroides cellulosolvens]KNY27276.1 type IV pilus assembly PilZ [Pseudobacteroides cellulosolvens ATCC 35603 = DSM 2933]